MPTHRCYTVARYEENFPGANVSGEEMEFARAMEDYQRRQSRRYPAWSEVLRVARALGYRRPGFDDGGNRPHQSPADADDPRHSE